MFYSARYGLIPKVWEVSPSSVGTGRVIPVVHDLRGGFHP